MDGLRAARMLSAMVPVELGGDGASTAQLGRIVEVLAQHCASTALIFAMHQIQMACLLRHGRNAILRDFLAEVVDRQLLLASATSEVGIGGDTRASRCALVRQANTFMLEKDASVISYGAHADALLATARGSADSPPNDQVLVVCRRPELQLECVGQWNTLGFRGTCGPPYRLRASGPIGLVLDDRYDDILAQTMLPVSHVLWGSVWLGIATQAMRKASRYVQASARRTPGVTPQGALRLVDLVAAHQQLSAIVHSAAEQIDDAPAGELATPHAAVAMNNLKVSASALAIDIVSGALLVTGMAGYREDGDYAMGRLLRDAYGGVVMVNNDRIVANTAQLLLAVRNP
jgi:acyl-CoA dehydrogenase